MNDHVRRLVEQIRALEDELQSTLKAQESRVRYRIEGKRVEFEEAVRTAHARLRKGVLSWLRETPPRHLASAPFIYGMFVPLVLFDLFLSLYHSVCFRLYRIPLVRRQDYIVIDRHRLAYLNAIEKLNCIYCGYANGLIAYAREISARTEQYWCPIKHARKVLGTHRRYTEFVPFGEGEAYQEKLPELRDALAREQRPDRDETET
jgi:hypothetical protein